MAIPAHLNALSLGIGALRKHQKMLFIGSLTMAFILLFAMIWRPPNSPVSYQFIYETGIIAWCSFTFLALGALGAVRLAHRQRALGMHLLFWAGMAVALAYLATDEVAGFHEAIGDANEDVDIVGGRVWGIFRSWNDIIVIGYGIAALIGWAIFQRVLLAMPMRYTLLVIAFGWYAVSTLIDSTVEPSTGTSSILEESAKLACGFFLALSVWLPNHPGAGSASHMDL